MLVSAKEQNKFRKKVGVSVLVFDDGGQGRLPEEVPISRDRRR